MLPFPIVGLSFQKYTTNKSTGKQHDWKKRPAIITIPPIKNRSSERASFKNHSSERVRFKKRLTAMCKNSTQLILFFK